MPRNKGGPAKNENLLVWLLGNHHPAADRSIGWHGQLPNLGCPDALVVDMTTLTENTIRQIDARKLDRVKKSIGDKLFGGGGTIIVITSAEFSAPPIDAATGQPIIPFNGYADPHDCSNYRILPAVLDTEPVDEGGRISPDAGHDFGAYLGAVGHSWFHITEYTQTSNRGPRGARFSLARVSGQDVRDGFGYDLGFTLVAAEAGRGTDASQAEGVGRLVFLPPYTEPAADAIGKILTACGKILPRAEAPPAWAERLSLGPADEYRAQIEQLKEDKAKIQGNIDRLERQRGAILAHRRLLYSDGPELEDAIVQAFRVLGFDDIERMGKADEEDAAFAMDGTGYSHGVIEAKGAGRGIQLQHILQCNRWTDRRAIADSRPSKGIFVPNQHRLKPYHKSAEIRMKIEPNQLEQAEMKDICIIPSCVLFEAVSKVLGGETPDRARIAGKIAATRGVLKDVL